MLRFAAWNAFHERKRSILLHGIEPAAGVTLATGQQHRVRQSVRWRGAAAVGWAHGQAESWPCWNDRSRELGRTDECGRGAATDRVREPITGSRQHPQNPMPITVHQLISRLEADGWFQVRQKGSHRQYHHPTKTGTVTVAGKPSVEVPPGTLRNILKQAGLKK